MFLRPLCSRAVPLRQSRHAIAAHIKSLRWHCFTAEFYEALCPPGIATVRWIVSVSRINKTACLSPKPKFGSACRNGPRPSSTLTAVYFLFTIGRHGHCRLEPVLVVQEGIGVFQSGTKSLPRLGIEIIDLSFQIFRVESLIGPTSPQHARQASSPDVEEDDFLSFLTIGSRFSEAPKKSC